MPVTYKCTKCKLPCNCKRNEHNRFVSYCCEATVVEVPVTALKANVNQLEASGNSLAKKISVMSEKEKAHEVLVDTLNDIGLDASAMANNLKKAMELALTRGKMTVLRSRTKVDFHYEPDLDAYAKLLMIWDKWMKVGGKGGTIGTANFNFGFEPSERTRLEGLTKVLEEEIRKRGVSAVLPGNFEVKDAETLPGVVGSGATEAEVVD